MSATCRATVKLALELIGHADPAEEPTEPVATAGLGALKSWLNLLPQRGVGGKLRDVLVTSSQTAASPSEDYWRLVMRHTSAATVYLPVTPQDGARVGIIDPTREFGTFNVTVNRNGWLLEGAAANQTLSTDGDDRIWFFRADLGDWVRMDAETIAALELDDEHPYPADFDDALAYNLALQLAPRFGKTPATEVSETAQLSLAAMKTRYFPRLKSTPDASVICMPGDIGRRRY